MGGLAAPTVTGSEPVGSGSAKSPPQPAVPSGIDVPTLRVAQTVASVQQTDDALLKALPLVARYRNHIERLRTVPLSDEVEPAFAFNPRRFGKSATPPHSADRTTSAVLSRSGTTRIAAPTSELDIAYATISELHAWLGAGQISSEQVTRLSLHRLKLHDATLSCVVTLADQRGLAEAKRADGHPGGHQPGAELHGLPYGAKDIFDTAGLRTQWGARPYLSRKTPTTDATAVARLSEAGACLTAKLSTGELAIGDTWSGEAQFEDGRPLSGTPRGTHRNQTRNPWDPGTGASGSSAGPAAAVAAGLVTFALGTETGGSIVSPASTCGVVGLRPTYGRVSRRGVMTLRWTLDKVGVLARSVADCGTVLRAIHGPDPFDPGVSDAVFTWRPHPGHPVRPLRLGVVEDELFGSDPNASEEDRARADRMRPIFAAAVEVYRRAGFEIVSIALPAFPASALYAIHNAEAGAMFDEITRSGATDDLEGQGPNDRSSQLRASRFIPAVDYIRAQRVRSLMIGAVEELFERIDVFLAPPSSESVNMTNLTGHPALVLPAGFLRSATGIEMPQSIMLTGRLDDEATLLDAGLAFEQETPWHTRRPPLYS